MSYINYECTICRRSKSFVKDNQRVMPDQCVITKGCLGRLIPSNETLEPQATKAMAGVDDWYARGTVHSKTEEEVSVPDFSLATSNTGSIVLAVKSNDEAGLPTQLNLFMEQKRVGDAQFQQFTFKVATSTSVISGRDNNGRNLRFDQLAIDEGRVVVRKNGVRANSLLSPDKAAFETALPSGTIVDVLVFGEKTTLSRMITLTRNKTLLPSLTRGSWSNIDYVVRAEVGGGTSKWYLYSVDAIAGLTAGKIKLIGNDVSNQAIFLMASKPYQSTDRYLNFVVPQSNLTKDFVTNHVSGRLTANQALLSEIFPPLVLEPDAFISGDLYTVESSSQIIADTEEARFASRKILGPV